MTEESPASVSGLVSVARMYYEQNLSQAQIATRLNKSRPTISRMLTTARDRGIVRIEIREPLDRLPGLERALTERFPLREARVVRDPGDDSVPVSHLGRAAADYLSGVVGDGMCVGVSNGRALAAVAKYLTRQSATGVNVVQIIGSLGTDDLTIDGPDIARALAAAYGAQCRYLHVPLLVSDATVRATLVRDRIVAQTLRMGRASDVVLAGVGTLAPSDRSPIFKGFLSSRDLAGIRQRGGIGHICGIHYDVRGQELDVDANRRTIGIGLEAMRRIPNVVAVAGGRTKAGAIVAGIRGGLIRSLVTDEAAATQMLTLSAP
jgi:deoxyribonucleoside regulator